MVVVSDTSPISGLYRIGYLHLLQLLYREVVIPNAVFEELVIGLLGVLAEAKAERHIPLVRPLMDRLIHDINFRVSAMLYKLVLEQVGE